MFLRLTTWFVRGRVWIENEKKRSQPCLDLFEEERRICNGEREEVERVLSNISNILINGTDLILDHVFNRIGDAVFANLSKPVFPVRQVRLQLLNTSRITLMMI